MQDYNQFIQGEQHQVQYFMDLFHKKTNKEISAAAQSSSLCIINRTIQHLETGLIEISVLRSDIAELLIKGQLNQDEKRKISNKKRLEEKKRINSFLKMKSQSNSSIGSDIPSHILSHQQHKIFIHALTKQKRLLQQKINRKQQQQTKQKQMSKSQKEQMEQLKRKQQLQVKKSKIKQNLKKTRQNHQSLLIKQKQSRNIFRQIHQRKKMHQKLTQIYEQNVVLPIIEQNKYKLKSIKDNSRLNMQAIMMHERQYLQLKKDARRSRKYTTDQYNEHNYSPLPHSQRINKILEQQSKNSKLLQIQKKKIKQKLLRMSNYTAIVREKYRPSISKTIKTMNVERQQSPLQRGQQKKDINRIELGNQYLKLAKKRAKTQPRHNTQTFQVQVKNIHEKPRQIGRPYLDSQKRQQILYKMKKYQIQNILDCKNANPQQQLKRMKQADLKLQFQMQKGQHFVKQGYNRKQNGQILNLLLTTIKAKINLLEIQQTYS